jgi:Family of unknown function (DUF5331)
MNIHHLRKSIKQKWLRYYQENRSWLTILRIWGNYDGKRRPSSGYMLGILSVLEPSLTEWLPLMVNLNSNPDDIINSLGLNFNPEEQLHLLETEEILLIPLAEDGQSTAVDKSHTQANSLLKTTENLPKSENSMTQLSSPEEFVAVTKAFNNYVSQNQKSDNGKSENGKSENNLSPLVANSLSLDETPETESEIEIYNKPSTEECQNTSEKQHQSIPIVKTSKIENSPRQKSENNPSALVTNVLKRLPRRNSSPPLHEITVVEKELIAISTAKEYRDHEAYAQNAIYQTLKFMKESCSSQLSTVVPLHTSNNGYSTLAVKEKAQQPLLKPANDEHPKQRSPFSVTATQNNSKNNRIKNNTIKKVEKNTLSKIPVISSTNAKNLPSWMDEFCDGK